MAAVEQLCTKAISLKKGVVFLEGDTKSVINDYLNHSEIKQGKIIDSLKLRNANLIIDSITLNGSDSNIVEIDSENNELAFEVKGTLFEDRKMALEVRFYDPFDRLQMLYSPGHLYGNLSLFKKGHFTLYETIKLPDTLTQNEFNLTIDLTQPNIEVLAGFPSSAKIICRGIRGYTGLEFPAINCGLLMLK